MGLRFRKSFSMGPLARLNLSLAGPSLSVGPRGASISVGRRGVHANVGLPGTGISWRERLDVVPRRRILPPTTPLRDATTMVRDIAITVLATVMILMATSAYSVLKESWDQGGPGTRHAADVAPLVRGGWGR